MNWRAFQFSFSFKGKSFDATCHVYTTDEIHHPVYRRPIYRVNVNGVDKFGFSFLFYKTDQPHQRFSHYQFSEEKEKMGKHLAQVLENIDG